MWCPITKTTQSLIYKQNVLTSPAWVSRDYILAAQLVIAAADVVYTTAITIIVLLNKNGDD
jgi:hypothetical protein